MCLIIIQLLLVNFTNHKSITMFELVYDSILNTMKEKSKGFMEMVKKDIIETKASIKELKKILKAEKIRKDITKKELLIKKNYYNDDLLRYLISIEKNIKVLDLYIEVLNNKYKHFSLLPVKWKLII